MLPALQYPKNAMLNFAPVTGALNNMRAAEDDKIAFEAMEADKIRQRALQADQIRATRENQNAMLGIRRDEFEQRQKMMPGQLTLQQLQIKNARNQGDPKYGVTQRRAIAAELGIAPTDPRYVPFVANGSLPKDDPLDRAINKFMEQEIGGASTAPAPATGNPNIRLQSGVEGGIQPGDPNLIKTQTADGTQPQPVARDMVNTPMGPMTMERAQKWGYLLALKNRGKAGELFTNAAKENALSAGTKKKMEEAELGARDNLQRLIDIKKVWLPEYQTWDAKIKAWRIGAMSSIEALRKTLPPEQVKEYQQYITARRRTVENMNLYIKYITGAQMSQAEAERLSRAQVNETDDPIAFEAKLNDAIRGAQIAIARMNYLRNRGFGSIDKEEAARMMSLDRMERIYESRGNSLMENYRKQGMTQDQAKPLVTQQLQKEFGI